MLLFIFNCKPIQKLWTPHVDGTCGITPIYTFTMTHSGEQLFVHLVPFKSQTHTKLIVINAATAFGLAIYPIFLLWHLQMPKRLKLGAGLLLSLSMFVGICAIMRAYAYSTLVVSSDTTCKLKHFYN